MSAYIGIDGFTLPSGFILKEMTIIYPNHEYDHFIFKKPCWNLTEADKRTIRYTTQNLNQLCYEDGHVSYEQIGMILDSVKDITLYTYSDIAVTFLQKHLPSTVIKNIQCQGYTMPRELPNSNCFRHHASRYCAKSKARAIQKFVEGL